METTKLYKKQDGILYYWQIWSKSPKSILIDWGVAGERSSRETIKAKNKSTCEAIVQEQINKKRQEGFAEAAKEYILEIEYKAEPMTSNKLTKLHRLGDHLDYFLFYNGLGAFDGNGFGFGKMDVSVIVVDFEIAKRVIAAELEDTIFGNYLSIKKVNLDETDES